MSKELEIFVDGACEGNPGPAGIGVVIRENQKIIKNISKSIGQATNNIAEYTAFIHALQEALILKADKLKLHTDSELLYNQLKGTYKVKNEQLKTLFDEVKHLAEGFELIDVQLIPREKNKEADKLATSAIKEQAKVVASKFRFGEESPSSGG